MVDGRVRRAKGKRLLILLGFILLIFILLASRLVWVQAVEANKFSKLAKKQRLRSDIISPKRGRIYDCNLQELATSVNSATLFANPHFIKDKKEAARRLAPILELPKKEVLEKISCSKGFVYLARKIPIKKAKEVSKLEIEGVSWLTESRRVYPYKNLAAHTIGFVGIDNEGLSGLELYYDQYLRGKPGKIIAEKDPLGRVMPGGIVEKQNPDQGLNLVLTIDKDIQYIADEKIKEAVEKHSAKAGYVIVMNPKNGEIYALASYPNFDPNDFSEAPEELLRNRAITDLYEPGSTMKSIIASAALEEKILEPNSVLHLPSQLQVADAVITDAHQRPAVDETLTQIVSSSSNIGAVLVGMKLGKEMIYQYCNNFGLTSRTGIDFPGEAEGFTPLPQYWSGTTIGNVPFGQGLSITPLGITRAIGIIANDGFGVTPHLMKEIRDNNGDVLKSYKLKEPQKVINSRTAEQMNEILKKVTEEGTAETAQIDGYQVAGKTGTAQKPRANGKGYEIGLYLSSFIGYAPASDPQILVSVFIDEPRGVYYASYVAAPVFKEVTEFSLNQLQIIPDKIEE